MVLVIIGVIVVWQFINTPEQDQDVVVIAPPVQDDPVRDTIPTIDDKPPVEDEPIKPLEQQTEDGELLGLVYFFVERWGTFSSVSNYQNVKELEAVMTSELYSGVAGQITEVSFAELDSVEYVGYTTRVVTIEWLEQGNTSALALVSTHREKETEDDTELFNQDIEVRFVRQGGKWLVSDAVWK